MADNLISTISQFLTPDLRAKIAGALGMDANMANKALGAAVPAILSSLGAVAATSGGASKISEVIGGQDLSVLDNLGSSLDTDGPMGLINSGSSTLSGLVGGAGMSALTGAISKFSGADADTSGSVLGLMGPIVTGVIGQQDPSNWTSGAGIANLFASQKSNIAAALPSGLGAMLGAGVAGMSGVAGMAGAARTSVSQSASAASSNAQAAVNEAKGGFPMWMLIVGALIIAALAWYFLSKPAEKPMVAAPAATQVAAPAMDAAAVTKSAGAMLDGLKTSLGNITDVATAKAALPQLTAATGELDKLSALPATAKSGITGLVVAAMPALKAQADKVLAIPGVGDVAKPTLDGLMAKLAALGK